MSSLEKEERKNFSKLKKLVFQVGLPSIRELFMKRYSQKYGNWEETPEFGEKLLKMLDDQNNGKGAEILKKYAERENIQSGKVSEWDYSTLQIILTNLDFGNSSTSSNGFEAENEMVEMLTQVGNNLVHDYSKEEKIPTNEFLGTLDEIFQIFDACFDLEAGKEVMDNIMELYEDQNTSEQNSTSGQNQMSTSEGAGGHQNFVYSSPQTTTINANISTAAPSLNNSVAFKIEDKNEVIFSQSLSEPMISSIYLDPEHVTATATISPAISSKIATAPTNYVQPSTFLSSSANSASTTSSAVNSKQQISSPAKLNAQNKSPPFPPAQTSADSETVNTTNNPATQKEDVSYFMLPFMFLHGIFLLVVSSVFLNRLVHFSAGIPNLDWMVFAIIAVCLGALRIILPLSCFLLLLLKDPKARSWFWYIYGFVYLLTVLSFGLLVMLFKFTNIYSETFLNYYDVEGIKNYRLYNWLFWAIVVEPALLCVCIVLLFLAGLIYAIGAAIKK